VMKIVCLVGSVSQEADWRHYAAELTKRGYVVFEAGSYDKNVPKETWQLITQIHWRKIELSDIVAIIRKPNGSIGTDTWHDIEFARLCHKEIEDAEYLL
jgi:hypothetical protein